MHDVDGTLEIRTCFLTMGIPLVARSSQRSRKFYKGKYKLSWISKEMPGSARSGTGHIKSGKIGSLKEPQAT